MLTPCQVPRDGRRQNRQTSLQIRPEYAACHKYGTPIAGLNCTPAGPALALLSVRGSPRDRQRKLPGRSAQQVMQLPEQLGCPGPVPVGREQIRGKAGIEE